MISHILKLIWNQKGRNSLMILEIFLSFLVLFFVLAYVFFNLDKVNAPNGFKTENRWMILLDQLEYRDSLESVAIIENLKSELEALNEVEEVSFTDNIHPYSDSQWRSGTSDNGFSMNALVVPVDLNLQQTLDMNVIDGRWFNEDDLNATIKPIIVNKKFMDEFYPNKSMIDSTFIFGGERKLVGVIDDYRYNGEFEDLDNLTMEVDPYQRNLATILLKLRPGVPAAFEEKLSNLLISITKSHGSSIHSLEKLKTKRNRESWLLLIALMTVCGFLCLNVALGLFGVLWYNISKRRSEIGLRQALGAHGTDITKQFIIEIVLLALIALSIGIFFAIQIPLLDITEYHDTLYYRAIVFASIIIISLVFLCALFPSIQAAKITPANALHED